MISGWHRDGWGLEAATSQTTKPVIKVNNRVNIKRNLKENIKVEKANKRMVEIGRYQASDTRISRSD